MPPNLAWLGSLAACLVAVLIALAGSQGGVYFAGMPLFALCVAGAFGIQWLAFIPAWFRQTEVFFDLVGSLTFIALALLALQGADSVSLRSMLIGALTILWALRLGSFLTSRIRALGSDRRFRHIKSQFAVFFMTWTLQGLWVTMSFAAGLAAISSARQVPADAFLLLGALLWVAGFVIEAVADDQKRRFRLEPGNEGRFISSGLWAWSQHPNYFGEILLWSGVAVMAFPVLSGWQHITLASPLFVWLLLTRISGMRMLDASASTRWGGDPAYAAYLARTPRLIPRPPRSDADNVR